MASEDEGLADPNALQVCLNTWQNFHLLGEPEGDFALAGAVVYLALAPKSNAIYSAFKISHAKESQTDHLSPPKTNINAPTKFMKEQGYGKGYIYDHEGPEGFSGQNHFPDGDRESFYHPVERWFERDLKKRLAYFKKIRKKT